MADCNCNTNDRIHTLAGVSRKVRFDPKTETWTSEPDIPLTVNGEVELFQLVVERDKPPFIGFHRDVPAKEIAPPAPTLEDQVEQDPRMVAMIDWITAAPIAVRVKIVAALKATMCFYCGDLGDEGYCCCRRDD